MNSNLFITPAPITECRACGQNCNRTTTEWYKHNTSCSIFHRGPPWLQSTTPLDPLLVRILLHYDEQNVGLRNELQEVKIELKKAKWSQTSRVKKQIEDILNTTRLHYPPFKGWVDSLDVSMQDLQEVFDDDLVQGVIHILNKSIDAKHSPFCAFLERTNILYLYDADDDIENKENNRWRQMTTKDIQWMVFRLSRRLLSVFVTWTRVNQNAMEQNESMRENYYTYLSKLNGAQKNDKTMSSEIQNWLYTHLAEPLVGTLL